ncbi:hypothetical protein PFISCL1PPCAC_16464, partial [Pristionchus fissidentatus]
NTTISEQEAHRCSTEVVQICTGHFLLLKGPPQKKIMNYEPTKIEDCERMIRDRKIDSKNLLKEATDRYATVIDDNELPSRSWFSDTCLITRRYILERGVVGILDDGRVISPLFLNAKGKIEDGSCTTDDAVIMWKKPKTDDATPRCRFIKVGDYDGALIDAQYIIIEQHNAAFRFDSAELAHEKRRCFTSPPHLMSTGAIILFPDSPNVKNMSEHILGISRTKRGVPANNWMERIKESKEKYHSFLPPFLTDGIKEMNTSRCDDTNSGEMYLKHGVSSKAIEKFIRQYDHRHINRAMNYLTAILANENNLIRHLQEMDKAKFNYRYEKLFGINSSFDLHHLQEDLKLRILRGTIMNNQIPAYSYFTQEIDDYLETRSVPIETAKMNDSLTMLINQLQVCHRTAIMVAAGLNSTKWELALKLVKVIQVKEPTTTKPPTTTEFTIAELLQTTTTTTSAPSSTSSTQSPSTTTTKEPTFPPTTTSRNPREASELSTVSPYLGYRGSASEIEFIKQSYDKEEDARRSQVNVSTLPGETLEMTPKLTLIDFKSPNFYESIRTSSFPTKLAVSFGQQMRDLRLHHYQMMNVIEDREGLGGLKDSLLNSTSSAINSIKTTLTGELLEHVMFYGGIALGCIALAIVLFCVTKILFLKYCLAKAVSTIPLPINHIEEAELPTIREFKFNYERPLGIYAVTSTGAPHVPVRIKNRVFPALWDSGSSVTYVSKQILETIGVTKMEATKIRGIGVGQHEFNFLGSVRLPLQIGEVKIESTVLVADDRNAPSPMLIGTSLMKELEKKGYRATLHLVPGLLELGDQMIPLVPSDLNSETQVQDVFIIKTATIPAGGKCAVTVKIDEANPEKDTLHEISSIDPSLTFQRCIMAPTEGETTKVIITNSTPFDVTINALTTIGESRSLTANLAPYCPKELQWDDKMPTKKGEDYRFITELNLDNCKLSPKGKRRLKSIIEKRREAFFTGNGQP